MKSPSDFLQSAVFSNRAEEDEPIAVIGIVSRSSIHQSITP
jgi:hypothetical protein